MGFADRVATRAPWVVGGVALVVAVAGAVWESFEGGGVRWSLLSLQAGVAVGAGIVTGLLIRRTIGGTLDQRDAVLRKLAGRDAHIEPADLEEDLASVVRAFNQRIDAAASEMQRARAELATHVEMLDVISNALVTVGTDGKIRYANPAARHLFGLAEDPRGRRPPEVFKLAELQDGVEAALRGETREHRCASGPHDLILRAYPLPGVDGPPAAMVVLNDVTRFREAERARTDFVANVSHELRTPVAAIAGYAETLLAEPERLPADLVPLLETIDRNARRLANLFEDLLRLHRIESRRQELPLTLGPLVNVLEECVGSAADAALRRDQHFELDCPEEVEGWHHAEALATIVSNLASNAVAYTNPGGRVLIRAYQAGDASVVEVTDDGIGIDAVHHDRIFERFYRVDEARSRRAGGTGLGLAIVKHLCIASDCRITVESALGKGTTFRVHLPAEPRPVE